MAVNITSAGRRGRDTAATLADLDRDIEGVRPQLAFVLYGEEHDDQVLSAYLGERFPGVAIVGGTSCSGVMDGSGLSGSDGIGFLLVEDVDGYYGSAGAQLGDDPAAAAERALGIALQRANCVGELPELVWVYQAPGHEEAVVEGLRRVVADRCPIIGGSSADDEVAGRWRQLGPDGALLDGLVVGVLFPSGGLGYAFQGGYEPTGASGLVTALGFSPGTDSRPPEVDGRHLLEIDHEPASLVYNRWNDDMLSSAVLAEGGTILADTTMCPLAVSIAEVDEVTHFRLIHPEATTAKGGLRTFATVEVGTRVFGMRGERERLVQRVGRVVSSAIDTLAGDDIAGAMLVYCGGCLLAVGDEAHRVAATANDALGGAPFLGCFTFGEQGVVLDRNVHANLMISAVVFGR